MKYRVEIRLRQGVKDIESEAVFQAANGNPELGDCLLYTSPSPRD